MSINQDKLKEFMKAGWSYHDCGPRTHYIEKGEGLLSAIISSTGPEDAYCDDSEVASAFMQNHRSAKLIANYLNTEFVFGSDFSEDGDERTYLLYMAAYPEIFDTPEYSAGYVRINVDTGYMRVHCPSMNGGNARLEVSATIEKVHKLPAKFLPDVADLDEAWIADLKAALGIS